jgi:hypothetical protein
VRKREKPLTLEEAVDAARKELLPRWFGASPLFAAFRDEKGAVLYALDPEARQQAWVWCVVDLASFESVAAIECFNRWHAMYGDLGLRFLLVVTRYGGSVEGLANAIDRLRKKYRFDYPVTFDPQGELAEALGCAQLPKAVFYLGERRAAETKGTRWGLEVEQELQRALRDQDPGLPLYVPQLPEVTTDGGGSRVSFDDKSVRYNEHWRTEGDARIVNNERGLLTLNLRGKCAGIVAMSDGESRPSRVFVSAVGNSSLPTDQWGKDVIQDDTGRTYFDVTAYGMYEFFRRDSSTASEIQLRFASATETPLVLKGIRVLA